MGIDAKNYGQGNHSRTSVSRGSQTTLDIAEVDVNPMPEADGI